MARHGELLELRLDKSETAGASTSRHGELSELRLVAATPSGHGELLEPKLQSAGAQPVVNEISDIRTDPLENVTITASLVGGREPQTWTFGQTDGPTVLMSGSGGTRTFLAPATVTGTILRIQVVATLDGIDSDPVVAVVSVYPQQRWKLLDTGWVAYKQIRVT